MKYNFEELQKDKEGRRLAVTLKAEEKCFNIVNIYAATKDKVSDQFEFLKLLDSNLDLAEAQFIIGCEFNAYLDPIFDKEGGKPEGISKFADNLINLFNEYNTVDVWRIQNPICK